MFSQCMLELAQYDREAYDRREERRLVERAAGREETVADLMNSNVQKWVKVRLLQARSISILGTTGDDPFDGVVWQYLRAQRDAADWWGRWHLGINSVTGTVNTGYTVGGSGPQNEKFWVFSPARQMLEFVEYWHMTGDEVEFKIAVSLHRGWISNRGIDPIISVKGKAGFGPTFDADADGRCDLASNILVPHYPVRWHREAMSFSPE